VSAGDSLASFSDEELMQRLRQGQIEVFGTLIRRYERELFGYLRRYLGEESLAEDVFQNTFLQVHLKCKQYEPGRPVRPWLYTIATHQAIDAMRRNQRHQTLRLEEPNATQADGEAVELLNLVECREGGPVEIVAAGERREQIRATVEALPDLLRQVLILAYYQGMKYREIAEVLEIPVGTVKSRLHAALSKLQESWASLPSLNEVP
jgi:RNA polymerase sigma-70 factor (ECF subfamily)